MRHIGDSVLSLRSNNQDFVYECYYIYEYIEFYCLFFAKNCCSEAPCTQTLILYEYASILVLRYCATNRKVAGSIPDGVIGIFL
jgi:hypothetical protein